MGKVKSSVWRYFIKDLHGATCKLCQRYVKCSGNTTNLSNHLKRSHKNIINNRETQLQTDGQVEVLEESPTETSSVSIIQRKIIFVCFRNLIKNTI